MQTLESPNPRDTQELFVSQLAESLHRYGTPGHELEEILQTCSEALELNADFFSTPTAIFISFPDSPKTRSVLKRVAPGEIDLEKLVAVDQIVTRFLEKTQTLKEATQELEQLKNQPASFPSWVYVLGFAVASGTVVGFLLGGLREILVTSAIGMLVGALEQWSRRNPEFGRVYCAVASFLAAFLAVAVSSWLPGLSSEMVTLGSLIVLIPGLTITMAISELSRQQLASGTSRFMGALLLFLVLGFGVALGRKVGLTIFQPDPSSLTTANPATFWACLLLAPFSFAVLFRTRRKDLFIVFITCLIGFGSGKLGTILLSPQLGPALGSFSVAVFSNLVSRALRQPAALTLVPGLMFLVPGSFGFLSLQALVQEDTISGIQSAFHAMFIAAALVFGLLLANLFVRPRKWQLA